MLAGAPEVNVGENYNQGMLYLFRPDPAPTVVAITRASANPTSAASVAFDVTFTKAMTGVDAEDFALTTTGTLGGVRCQQCEWLGRKLRGDGSDGKGRGHAASGRAGDRRHDRLPGNSLSDCRTRAEVYLIERVTVHLPFLWRGIRT